MQMEHQKKLSNSLKFLEHFMFILAKIFAKLPGKLMKPSSSKLKDFLILHPYIVKINRLNLVKHSNLWKPILKAQIFTLFIFISI
jgi:hypothetical protein